MRKYLFLCLMLSSALSYAQSPQPSVKRVMPPSPEASACFKFIEEPVSAYTGLVNTSVPIFNIRLKEINIPVTMNYHSRGVRVDEIASRVGIGWSLEYGGMVTRAIRGVADDGLYGIMNDYLYPGAFNNNTTRAALFNRFLNDTHCDEISDVYSYSNSHSSGKFFFDHFDEKFVLQQYADVKIEPVYEAANTAIAGWIITDDKGTRYYYGLSENKLRKANDVDYVTKNHIYDATCGTLQQNPEFEVRDINTWHLMEVRTVFNEKVEFFYQLETSYYFRKNADEVHQPPQYPSHIRTNISEMVSHQYQVAEIRFPGGKVVFTKESLGRGDLKGAYALDSVKILNDHAELTKSFRFSYFYTKDNNTSNVLPYLSTLDTSAARRMFLGQVQERGSSGLAQPPYIFEYHVPNPLPNRFSTSQDAWGYYNGANNGYYSIIQNLGALQNVTVDTVKSELGLLKKISYPTGGYTSFTYEHNRAVLPEQFYNAFYKNPNPVVLEDKSAGMSKFPFYYDSTSESYKQTITIGEKKVGNVRSSVTFSPSDGCSETEDLPSCPWQIFLFGNPYSFKLLKGVHDRVIPPGNYTLEVVPSGSIDLSDFRNTFNVVLSWQEE
ncbi:MAG TPA: hypothetical protein PKE30_20050, partial [Niabella sp.]|nr:hypothetical protein [Niabella sp.]